MAEILTAKKRAEYEWLLREIRDLQCRYNELLERQDRPKDRPTDRNED